MVELGGVYKQLGGGERWLLSSKDKEIFEICDNCFYFSLHRENMIPDKLYVPGTGKCIVFVHLMDGFVLPCPVDLHQVKSNIKHFLALFRVGAQCLLGSQRYSSIWYSGFPLFGKLAFSLI